MQKVGKICKRYREKYFSMTQRELALKYNETVNNIGAFEQGRTNNFRIFNHYFAEAWDRKIEKIFMKDIKELS